MQITSRSGVAICVLAALTIGAVATAIAANDDDVAQLLGTNKCALCDLSRAQLGGKNLSGADLSGANLSDAVLYGTNLQGANLAGANLSGANLKMANLSGATEAALAGASTDDRTTCPNGDRGPCQ